MKHVILPFVLFTIILAGHPSAFTAEARRIPFTLDRNRIVLPVRINDSPPLKIIIDTGMQFNGLLLYNDQMKQFLDPEKTMSVKIPGGGGGEPSDAFMADSGSFVCGDVVLTNQRILVLQNERFKKMRSDGLTGYSLLGHYMVKIDYDEQVISLYEFDGYEPDSSWYAVPLYFKSNTIPWLDAIINIKGDQDVSASLYIDSAAGETLEILTFEGMKFVLPDQLEDVLLGIGLSGEIYGQMGTVQALKLGPYEINNIRAAFTSREIRSKQHNADAVLGGEALKRFNLIFDYQGKKLYLKPNRYFY